MTLLVVIVAFALAGIVQSVTGFGFALVAVPVLGIITDPVTAVAGSTVVGGVHIARTAWLDRADVDRVVARTLLMAAVVGTVPGAVLLVTSSAQTLLLLIAAATLVCTAIVGLRIRLPVARTALLGAGFASGVLSVSTGTSGPPLVAALQARGLDPARFRATMCAVLTAINVVVIGVLVATSKVSADARWVCLVGIPVVVASSGLGRRLAGRVDPIGFRRAVLVTLVVASLAATLSALGWLG